MQDHTLSQLQSLPIVHDRCIFDRMIQWVGNRREDYWHQLDKSLTVKEVMYCSQRLGLNLEDVKVTPSSLLDVGGWENHWFSSHYYHS